MLLCLDVGNSHIYGGVFAEDKCLCTFRQRTRACTSDEFGIFLRNVLRENDLNPAAIAHIAICSVTPHLDYSLSAACQKYFACQPFMLQAGVETGLHINYRNPLELGSDRIANAIAASTLFPRRDLLIIDFGTASKVCALRADNVYLGGAILPGMQLSMDVLQARTAKLPTVNIIQAETCVGRSTVEGIQAGLYFGTLGACRALIEGMRREVFDGREVFIIGTGGFAHLFSDADLFDDMIPDLVLSGLRFAWLLNHTSQVG